MSAASAAGPGLFVALVAGVVGDVPEVLGGGGAIPGIELPGPVESFSMPSKMEAAKAGLAPNSTASSSLLA